jgi:AAA domain
VKQKEQRGVDLVVFDSLAVFLPARTENSAGVMVEALAPFLALAEAGLAVWLLHHPSKGEPPFGDPASASTKGSGLIWGNARKLGGNSEPLRCRTIVFTQALWKPSQGFSSLQGG